MAITVFHVPGATPPSKDLTTLALSSTELPNSRAFKLQIDATDGVIVYLNKAFWSVKHSGADSSDAASTADVYYAHGLTVPTCSQAVTSAIQKASIPIENGVDEIIGADVEEKSFSVFFKSASGNVVLYFRRNDTPLRGQR